MKRMDFARWNPWRGLGDLPRSLWILFAATLVNRAGTMVLPFLALYVTEGLRLPASKAAAALTAYGLASLVASPVGGMLCDRLGAVTVMRSTLVTSGLVLLAFPFAPSWGWVLLATVVYAILSEAFRPASMAALVEMAPPDQRKASFAMIRLAVNLGMSVGPALGGFLATMSFSSLFWFDGATSLLAAAMLVAWLPRRNVAEAVEEHASGATAVRVPDVPSWRNRHLILFLAACLPIILVFFQHIGPMPLDLVQNMGRTTAFYGLLFTLNTVLIVFLEVRINFATAHWTHARSVAIGSFLTALGFGALAVAREPWSVAATVVVWTFGEMILLPAMSDYVAEVSHPRRRGEAMGIYTMTWGLALSFGPSVGTLVLERAGPVALWGSCLVLGIAAAVLLGQVATLRLSTLAPPRSGLS